jgi:predicted transcriptional regulator
MAKDKDTKETRDEVRSVRLEKALLEKLEKIAKADERSISFLLHKAVEEFVKNR